MHVNGVVTFCAPCSGGFHGTIPAGEILIVDQEPPASARGTYFVPARYKDFEHQFVSDRDRSDPKYSGYAIACSFDDIDSYLELV